MSCLLWENEFYEDGQSIADRISETAELCSKQFVACLAVEARNEYGIRHAPLILLLELIRRGGSGVSDAIFNTIRRPDEITELVTLYWRNGKFPLSKQMKLGLAKCFGKFNEYQFAKYDRDGPVKLRDVLFLCHAKPEGEGQTDMFVRIANQSLKKPDTWEVSLSEGKDKKETFERLIKEGKLGYMALLRNLRKMMEVGCDKDLISNAIIERKGANMVFPFRYVAAARACPQLEVPIDKALCAAVGDLNMLKGETIVLVDVSASMEDHLSSKSDMTRMDAACALASIVNCERLRIFSFSRLLVEVPPRKGMAGVDAIRRSQPHGGTLLGQAIQSINDIPHDRLIVITDEQSRDRVPNPVCENAYMINVASNINGVGYHGGWNHIDGFSEKVLSWIDEMER